eukprot:scaffold598_cov207-Chaetoceros_neogracile.AAC.5
MNEAQRTAVSSRDNGREELDAATEACNEAKAKVNDAQHEKDTILGIDNRRVATNAGALGRGARVVRTNQFLVDQDKLEDASEKLFTRKDELRAAKRIVEDAKKKHNDCEEIYFKWTDKFPHRTRVDLLQFASELGEPGKEYFRKQFLDPDGDLFNAKQVADCCGTLFNPLWLKERDHDIELEMMCRKADELLPLFGFSEFTEDFITQLKKEIPGILARTNTYEFDWDGMENSRLFKTRLEKRKRRAKEAEDVSDDWKLDAGEKATRIWEWWREIVVDDKDFPCFSLALRLVGTMQVSSCAVERVFSQLKLIREVCGDNLYRDMLELRMFARCNGDLVQKGVKHSGILCETLSDGCVGGEEKSMEEGRRNKEIDGGKNNERSCSSSFSIE